MELQGRSVPTMPQVELGEVSDARNRLKFFLVLINLGILGLAGVLSYFLAGRTLKPIKEMVDEQNRFIADASHELRTPLTALKTATEVSLRDNKLNLTQAKKLLKSNLEDVNNLQNLSNRLLELAGKNGQNNVLHISQFPLHETIKNVVSKLKALSDEKKLKIEEKVIKEDLTIEADQQKIEELVTILLDNAIKYSPKGSSVSIEAKSHDGLMIELFIRDFGVGISQKDLPFIFDRFYRAEKSRTKTSSEGFGLGLSIAKKIIDDHFGTVEVSSQANKGTTFNIKLPKKHLPNLSFSKLFLKENN
jgi:two-component system, OmpR family, sensor histidine kinase CiaH